MKNFVFLPDSDFAEMTVSATGIRGGPVLASLSATPDIARALSPGDETPEEDMEIVKVVPQSGAALVRMNVSDKSPPPTVRKGTLHEVVLYEPAIAQARIGRRNLRLNSGPAGASFFQLRLVFSDTGAPISNAVATIVPQSNGLEITAVSDANGDLVFGMRAAALDLESVMVEAGFAGHWGFLDRNIRANSGDTIQVDRIDPAVLTDALRTVMRPGSDGEGDGVVVGIVDSGVGPHGDLPNASGDADSSIGHGTHVAGIVAGRGPAGLKGIAPGCALRSYRVFDDPETNVAANFEIHRAIQQAVEDGCHLINLSLKLESRFNQLHNDAVVSRALEDATDRGVLVIAAAGNDFRRFVAFPARHRDVLAVSACGKEGALPEKAVDTWTISRDRGNPDEDLFFARFSNEGVDGTEVDVVAPGAGIVSTVPGNTYAPMSGTSMACPAACGAIARILSANPDLLDLPADRTRHDAFVNVIKPALVDLGFGVTRQGNGMIQ